MFKFDFSLIIRCLLFLIIVGGVYFGLYLLVGAYKKTLEKGAYLLGTIFVLISVLLILLMTTNIF